MHTKILKDSIGPAGVRLTTWELRYPRFVHAELMTHRVFSRNSASSRAIPVLRMLETIENDPALPVFWGKNQKGMQAVEALTGEALSKAMRIWDEARDASVNFVRRLQAPDVDLHKQLANRLTEPWMYITVIVSATSFSNWFRLRHHKDAQPEIKWVATDMLGQYKTSSPEVLKEGEWHLPMLEDRIELEEAGHGIEDLKAISAGRIARVSYLTHDGRKSPAEDIALGKRLSTQNPPHMSPLEHVAQAMTIDKWNYLVAHKLMRAEGQNRPFNPMMFGNFVAWHQYRKEFENEHGFDFNLEEL